MTYGNGWRRSDEDMRQVVDVLEEVAPPTLDGLTSHGAVDE